MRALSYVVAIALWLLGASASAADTGWRVQYRAEFELQDLAAGADGSLWGVAAADKHSRHLTLRRLETGMPGAGAMGEVPLAGAQVVLAVPTLDDRLYLAVRSGEGTADRLEAFDTRSAAWARPPAAMPTPRRGIALATSRGRLMAMGGVELDGRPSDAVEIYDPSRNSWQRRAALPAPRPGLSIAAVGDRIYAVGGTGPTARVDAYDPARDRWDRRADLPWSAQQLRLVVVGERLLAFIRPQGNGDRSLRVLQYDGARDEWREAPMAPLETGEVIPLVAAWRDGVLAARRTACSNRCRTILQWHGDDQALSVEGLIDQHLAARWRDRGISPAPRSDDTEFQRRVTLDLLGRVPSSGEIERFSSNRQRERLVDELLAHQDFAAYWSERLASHLFGYASARQGHDKQAVAGFIRASLVRGLRYDAIVRELIVADPKASLGAGRADAGAFVGHFAAQTRNPKRFEDLVDVMGQAWMGTKLNCAQCHDHRSDKRMTRDDYYGLVAFFGRLRIEGGKVVESGPVAYKPERYTGSLTARFLDGGTPRAGETPRAALARLLIGSPAFARTYVDFFWKHTFGHSLATNLLDPGVVPEDELPPLLHDLARQARADGFDMRLTLRRITLSAAYQLSSKDARRLDPALFASQSVRPMNPEQMFLALSSATGLERAFRPGPLAESLKYVQRHANGYDFLRQRFIEMVTLTSDPDNPHMTHEFTANIKQVLDLMAIDSDFYAGLRVSQDGRLREITIANDTPEAWVGAVYQATLSRRPSDQELRNSLAYLERQGRDALALRDLYWALLNSNEFFFNH